MSPPSDAEIETLKRAEKIAVVQPGDVFFFSSSMAHLVLTISDELSVGTYEAITNPHPGNVQMLFESMSRERQFYKCLPEEEDIEDMYDDVWANIKETIIPMLGSDESVKMQRLFLDCAETTLRNHEDYFQAKVTDERLGVWREAVEEAERRHFRKLRANGGKQY